MPFDVLSESDYEFRWKFINTTTSFEIHKLFFQNDSSKVLKIQNKNGNNNSVKVTG